MTLRQLIRAEDENQYSTFHNVYALYFLEEEDGSRYMPAPHNTNSFYYSRKSEDDIALDKFWTSLEGETYDYLFAVTKEQAERHFVYWEDKCHLVAVLPHEAHVFRTQCLFKRGARILTERYYE